MIKRFIKRVKTLTYLRVAVCPTALTEKGMQYTQQVLELFYRSENEAMRRTLEIHSPDFIDSLTSYADFLQEEIKKKPQQEGIKKK